MQPSPAGPGRIPGYDLNEPAEDDARAALQRVFGAERGDERWGEACAAAGLSPGAVNDRPRLQRVVRALAGQGGPAATIARSLEIRMRTYDRLAALSAATTGGGR